LTITQRRARESELGRKWENCPVIVPNQALYQAKRREIFLRRLIASQAPAETCRLPIGNSGFRWCDHTAFHEPLAKFTHVLKRNTEASRNVLDREREVRLFFFGRVLYKVLQNPEQVAFGLTYEVRKYFLFGF
jgi:hypothetical protein